jgi:hypothetical protein
MASRIKDPQTMYVLPTSVVVKSESDPSKSYHVQLPYCPCADYAYRRANPTGNLADLFCKHLRNALETVGGWHQPPPRIDGALLDQAVVFLVNYAGMGKLAAQDLLARAYAADDGTAAKDLTGLVAVRIEYDPGNGRYAAAVIR